MSENFSFPNLMSVVNRFPQARADIKGDASHPSINGTARFFQTQYGVVVITEVMGLPTSNNKCSQPIFGYHIHEGSSCTGNENDPFFDAGMHYNPNSCAHPFHAGDLPPLFGANQMAFSVVLTDRFTIDEIVGKTIIIHSKEDDFTTQPSGNVGTKIACGEIKAYHHPLSIMFKRK